MVNNKMFFLTRIANARRDRGESGAAMMFAVIVLLLCTVLSIIIAMFTGTSLVATRALGSQINYNAAVQDALSNAYLGANNTNGINFLNAHAITSPSTTSCTTSAAATGVVPRSDMTLPAKWSWYSQRVASTGGQIYYNIFAYGYASNGSCTDQTARKVRLTLTQLDAISACYSVDGTQCLSTSGTTASNSQTIVYRNTSDAVFAYGILGTNAVTLGSSSSVYPKIYSYDSGVTNLPTPTKDSGNSSVATNTAFKLYSNNTNLRTFIKLKNSTCADQTGGDNDACEKLYVDNRQYAANISSLDSTSYLSSCTSGPAWTASSGVPLSNYGCYSSITFDANIPPVSPALKIYTYGPITVSPGVSVNYGGASSNLQIYSSSTGCSLGVGTGTTDITQFSGLIAGSKLNCTDTTGNGTLNYYGAMAASTVSLTNAGTSFYIDEASRAITSCSAASNCRQVWNRSTYVSLN